MCVHGMCVCARADVGGGVEVGGCCFADVDVGVGLGVSCRCRPPLNLTPPHTMRLPHVGKG